MGVLVPKPLEDITGGSGLGSAESSKQVQAMGVLVPKPLEDITGGSGLETESSRQVEDTERENLMLVLDDDHLGGP
jgi:hypothetical protein